MSIDRKNRYDAEPERLFTVMTDEGFLREKYASLGQDDFEVLEHSVAGDRVTVRTRRVVPADVPGFAKKFISPRSVIVQTERWEGGAGQRHGTWSIEVEGTPISITGTMSIEADGAGAAHVIHGDVKVKVPLVGGKIGEFVAENSGKAIDEEVAYTRSHLAKG